MDQHLPYHPRRLRSAYESDAAYSNSRCPHRRGRCVLRSSQGLTDQWVILSHCWGSKPAMAATHLTLSTRENGIRYDNLPKTFRDVVKVTRQLGIQFLLINSLCIIQNPMNPMDWLTESSKILEYYRDAYVTISALDSEDSFAGFLYLRK